LIDEPLGRGSVVWVDFDPTRGREQRGTRPALVVSSSDYLASVRELVIVVPITSVDRNWPHHVPIQGRRLGLSKSSFAMTEQPRTVSRGRVGRQSGTVDEPTMAKVDEWLRDFMGL
jgi:mRNA interferase MazF